MNDLSELINECGPLESAKSVNYEVLAMARRLGDLGFDHLAKEMSNRVLLAQKLEEVKAGGFPVVTPAKIKKFLAQKAATYNEQAMKTYSREMIRGVSRNAISNLFDHVALYGPADQVQNDWFKTSSPEAGSQVFTMDAEEARLTMTKSYVRFTAMTNDLLSPAKDRIAGFAWEEVPVKEYKAIPPDHALEALKKAREKEIFHDFTIASVSHVKDPLLLGVLAGVQDRFFLAQWGEDVALDDVI